MTVNFAKVVSENVLTSLINTKNITEKDLKELFIEPVYFELVDRILKNILSAKLESSHYFRFEMTVCAQEKIEEGKNDN